MKTDQQPVLPSCGKIKLEEVAALPVHIRRQLSEHQIEFPPDYQHPPFQIGDVVSLKGQGEPVRTLTVADICGQMVDVAWFGDLGQLHSDRFNWRALEKR